MYFIYVLKDVGVSGKIQPSANNYNKTNVQLGLSCYDKYYLGFCNTKDDVSNLLNDFIIKFISDQEANGFKLLNTTQIQEDANDSSSIRPLNSQEEADKLTAQRLINKLNVRDVIFANVDDDVDLLADVCKRVDVLQYIIANVIPALVNGTEVPSEIVNYLSDYASNLNNTLKSCGSVTNSNLIALGQSLDLKNNEVANILEQQYWSHI